MRNPHDLAVFRSADELVLAVYAATASFPGEERYGLTQQIRRAAVSVASNIVEGCSRESQADFRRFIEIATGSAMELQYQLSLASRLRYHPVASDGTVVNEKAEAVVKALINLGKTLRAKT